MNSTYLSIGTVLMLRGEGKKVMVIGYLGTDDNGKEVDYMAVTYPEGYMSAENIVGFNKNEVLQILHEGYRDVEQERFFNEITAYLQGVSTQNSPTVPFVNTPTQPVVKDEMPKQNNNNDVDVI